MNYIQRYIDNPNEDLVIKSANWLKPNRKVMMGIDEAGRGPVLGPMVYAAAFYPVEFAEKYSENQFADSKTLSEERREDIFEDITKDPNIAWIARIISPHSISCGFYRREKYNLNEISHDAATELVRSVVSTNVKVDELYVDTVGKAEKYRDILKKRLPTVGKITVESKADAKFPVVSASSIVAKVLRDLCVSNWRFPENSEILGIKDVPFGSGYPGDSISTGFLRKCFNRIFGFPTFVRTNWSTASLILDAKGYPWDLDESLTVPVVSSKATASKNTNDSSKRKITNFFMPVAKKIKSNTHGSQKSEFLKKTFSVKPVTQFDQLFSK